MTYAERTAAELLNAYAAAKAEADKWRAELKRLDQERGR